MDLITKLQNLKETTQSREVRDLCETYISELKNDSSNVSESQVNQIVESLILDTESRDREES